MTVGRDPFRGHLQNRVVVVMREPRILWFRIFVNELQKLSEPHLA